MSTSNTIEYVIQADQHFFGTRAGPQGCCHDPGRPGQGQLGTPAGKAHKIQRCESMINVAACCMTAQGEADCACAAHCFWFCR